MLLNKKEKEMNIREVDDKDSGTGTVLAVFSSSFYHLQFSPLPEMESGDINDPHFANEQPLSPMGDTIQLYTPQLATVQEVYVQKNIYPISDLVLLPHTSHYIRPSLE